MRNPSIYGAGGVLSADIALPEHEREVEFYSKILTTGDAPLWRNDLMNNLGTPIIGLGLRTPEYNTLPLQWMPHFQVTDVAVSAKCAIDNGAKEIMHGKDDDGQSQWAVLVDPDGAAFGLIPVVDVDSHTQQPEARQGKISWLSLSVPNASTSQEFYQRVIGWNSRPARTENDGGVDEAFEMLIDNDTTAAEICQIESEQNEIPAVWLIHLPVDDFAESLHRVVSGGGKVVKEFIDEKRAIVRDPVGIFWALQASKD